VLILWFGFSLKSDILAQVSDHANRFGFDVKKPVMAGACLEGCPWGEIGVFVRESMKPFGYEVELCRNCGRTLGPGLVSNSLVPPLPDKEQLAAGSASEIKGKVDFGVTATDFLIRAYHGEYEYKTEGPYKNLRLIAKIEDPFYVVIAVKSGYGITDLAEIREKRLPLRIVCMDSPLTRVIMEYYDITKENLESWGGSIGNVMTERENAVFDVIISDLGSPANNPESDYWTYYTYNYKLDFIPLPDDLLNLMVAKVKGSEIVTAKWGLLKGIKKPFKTVARSGESVFARDDTPEQAAYDMAKAIDQNRANLKWYIRPYSYDSHTVWKTGDVPLHPGAERYYREVGYIKD
jgi:TRAP-type uncharacterized transport system substrate-binding protein